MLVLRRRVGESLKIVRHAQVIDLEITQLLPQAVMIKLSNVDPVHLGCSVIGHYPDGAVEVAVRQRQWLSLAGGIIQVISDNGQAKLAFNVDDATKIWRTELLGV